MRGITGTWARPIAVYRDLCVRDIIIACLQDAAVTVRVVAVDRSSICLCRIGDDSEARHRASVTVATRVGEFAGRHSLLPSARFEMMVVAHRVSQLWFEVLQLLLPIVVKQPVKGLLVIRPATS